ncbi:MAG: SH3 domain-containing protein [Anaerolineae bacterium]|jgi:hypothetical protein|nr:SH3 domain-containing protein [Anaerolineae bacterium]
MMLMLMMVFGLMCGLTAQDSLSDQARQAYEAQNFAMAARLYEALIAQGQTNAENYFNLGNTYFELNDLGRALLNYQRAHRLMPRDAELSRNMALIRALRVDVQSEEGALIDTFAAFTSGVMTTDELVLIVILLWSVFCGVLVVWQLRPIHPYRTIALTVTGLLVIGAMLLIGRVYVERYRPQAVVIAFIAQAHSGPGASYPPLFTLYSGAELRAIGHESNWLRIILPDGRQGWMLRQDLGIVDPDRAFLDE